MKDGLFQKTNDDPLSRHRSVIFSIVILNSAGTPSHPLAIIGHALSNIPMGDRDFLQGIELDQALEKASNYASARPSFYKLLMESKVYVIGQTEPPSIGVTELSPGDKLAIQPAKDLEFGNYLPFFSSLGRLHGFAADETRYLRLPARALLEIVRGERMILNPGAMWSKYFMPDEIERLLAEYPAI